MSDMLNERSNGIPHVGERGGEPLDRVQENIVGVPGFEVKGRPPRKGVGATISGNLLNFINNEKDFIFCSLPQNIRPTLDAVHQRLVDVQKGLTNSTPNNEVEALFSFLREVRLRILGVPDFSAAVRLYRLSRAKDPSKNINALLVQDPQDRAMKNLGKIVESYFGEKESTLLRQEDSLRDYMAAIHKFFDENSDDLDKVAPGLDPLSKEAPGGRLPNFKLETLGCMNALPWSVPGTEKMNLSLGDAVSKAIGIIISESSQGRNIFSTGEKKTGPTARVIATSLSVNYDVLGPDDRLMFDDMVVMSIDMLKLFGYGGSLNPTFSKRGYGDQLSQLFHPGKLFDEKKRLLSTVWWEKTDDGRNIMYNGGMALDFPGYLQTKYRNIRGVNGNFLKVNMTVRDVFRNGHFNKIDWTQFPNALEEYMAYIGSAYRIHKASVMSLSPKGDEFNLKFFVDLKKDLEAVLAVSRVPADKVQQRYSRIAYCIAASLGEAKNPSRGLEDEIKRWDPDSYQRYKKQLISSGFLESELAEKVLSRVKMSMSNPVGIFFGYIDAKVAGTSGLA